MATPELNRLLPRKTENTKRTQFRRPVRRNQSRCRCQNEPKRIRVPAQTGDTKRTQSCRPTQRNQSRCRFQNKTERTQFRSATAGCPPGPISYGTLRNFRSNWSGKGTEFNISALKFTDPCLLHRPLADTPPESPASATAPCQKSGPRFRSRPRQIRLRVAPPASAVIRLLNLRDEEGWVRGGILGCCLHPSFGF